jgi:hypothetical protein
VLYEFPVAVDVGVEMSELAEQGAFGLGICGDSGSDDFVLARFHK